MPAPSYTLEEAAIHELGHAITACALDIPFKYVELRPADPPRVGWGGQCLLVAIPAVRVVQDAFQLGGPILQILTEPASLGAHLALFQPSLFSSPARCMDPNDAFIFANSDLGWGSDLYTTGMMQQANGWPVHWMQMKFGGPKPWVLGLEGHMRTLLDRPAVHDLANELRVALIERARLDAPFVQGEFASRQLGQAISPLAAYVATQPP